MTNSTGARPAVPPTYHRKKRLGFLPGWRTFTYVVIAFNVLAVVWIISGLVNVSRSADCAADTDACQAGVGIGVVVLVVLWALGDVILGVLWIVTNRGRRDCPVCGNAVRRGVILCQACGHDFQRAAQQREAAPT